MRASSVPVRHAAAPRMSDANEPDVTSPRFRAGDFGETSTGSVEELVHVDELFVGLFHRTHDFGRHARAAVRRLMTVPGEVRSHSQQARVDAVAFVAECRARCGSRETERAEKRSERASAEELASTPLGTRRGFVQHDRPLQAADFDGGPPPTERDASNECVRIGANQPLRQCRHSNSNFQSEFKSFATNEELLLGFVTTRNHPRARFGVESAHIGAFFFVVPRVFHRQRAGEGIVHPLDEVLGVGARAYRLPIDENADGVRRRERVRPPDRVSCEVRTRLHTEPSASRDVDVHVERRLERLTVGSSVATTSPL